MKIQEIRSMAKAMGVKVGNMKKTDAIRTIQKSEGNFDCYGRAVGGYCDQGNCLFYDDCMKTSQEDAN